MTEKEAGEPIPLVDASALRLADEQALDDPDVARALRRAISAIADEGESLSAWASALD